ncbi:MAG: hypothetical protein RL213_792 [Bacteroidota bacterium]|jgi:pimeloyl-ACP methyl ester carboxylesterase
MKLHFKETGEGPTLIILHGLFGCGDNWATLGKAFAGSGRHVVMIDQRNHGRSPHDPAISYPLMADDVQELIVRNNWKRPALLGHSMGGKTAMFHARLYPDTASALIVADIAPRSYPPHHGNVFSAIHAVELAAIASRKEAEAVLHQRLKDTATEQFLLKSLYWNDVGRLDWRFNLTALEENIEAIGAPLPEGPVIPTPTLFICGENSGYVSFEDEEAIRLRFADVTIRKVPGAGHWVHADAPEVFRDIVLEFLERQ